MKLISCLFALIFSSYAFADAISIRCKNTKIPNAKKIELGNGDDFGKSGSTDEDWSLGINDKDIKGATVNVLGKETNVSGFIVTLKSGEGFLFTVENESKGFVFQMKDGKRVQNTASFCSVDID